MQKIDWTAEARHMVRHVSKHMFEAHRGAMPWKKPGISVAFGNDGHDKRQINEIATLIAYLREHKIKELGFAATDDRYSWVMIVKSDNPDQFVLPLWAGWLEGAPESLAAFFYGVQSSIAERVIEDHGIKPDFVTK